MESVFRQRQVKAMPIAEYSCICEKRTLNNQEHGSICYLKCTVLSVCNRYYIFYVFSTVFHNLTIRHSSYASCLRVCVCVSVCLLGCRMYMCLT